MSDSPHIFNVTETDFNQLVIENSKKQPVFVDFWADWCQPCKTLMPMLEKLANEYQGKFLLAKVNSDEQKSLASQQAIRSLPTIKVFKNGIEVDSFMGVQPEPVLRKIIDTHIDSESEVISAQGLSAIKEGDTDKALELLNKAVEIDPARESLKLNLAKGYIAVSDTTKAIELVKALPIALRSGNEAENILAMATFIDAAKDTRSDKEMESDLINNPDDLQTRYQLGARKILADANEAGLKHFLEIMQCDRKFKEDIGHNSILAVFKLLGANHELAKQYRRKLAMLLH
ncbi:MAG: thioredoxin [Gammaproteobacteria bacterium]|nr:thioredoxin [Gammaproteobacteria bacterium]